jgi:oligopeptidase A
MSPVSSSAIFEQAMLPRFSNIRPEGIESTVRQLLAEERAKLNSLLSNQENYTWDKLMQPLEALHAQFSEYWSPISHLHAVMESEALRAVYHQVLPVITEHYTELSQNEKLYQAISVIAEKELENLNNAQRKIIENDLRDFKLSGVHLPPDKKIILQTLQKKLTEKTTLFADHILDATHAFTLHITEEPLLTGLPANTKALLKEQAEQKGLVGYVLTLDYPVYSSAMRYLSDRNIRQNLYEAYVTRASECGPHAGKWDNTFIMEEIISIRHEIAKLVGFDNYAVYSLATKMAKSSERVLNFLEDLLTKSLPVAQQEYDTLRKFAEAKDGLPKLEPWDVAYYSEQLQKELFHFTQEDLRPYFPAHAVINGLFAIMQKIFGLKIEAQKNVEVWHKDVQFFAIYDEDNHLRGGVYMDLYARPHKRDGAWMDECRTRRQFATGKIQLPVAYLTCNFMRPVGHQPALLTHDDVLTLFHEFGHCLHHVLTQVDYPSVAGINGVPWDAVEFPSQFLENFCWEKEAIELLSHHVDTGETLPQDLYEKMVAAKNFQAGLQMVRQLEFSLFDFRLHLNYDPQKEKQVQAVLDEVRQQTAIAPVLPANRFQHSFSHVFAGSYAAGYYSYKWADVLAADGYEKFEEDGIFNRATGRAFMQCILEVGGVPDPMAAFVAFRGREVRIDALLRHHGLETVGV